MTQAGRPVPTFTTAMLASWLFFASVPLWIERVGLYQYLGVEILIFATYALAFNLVLGHAGLPSFGHGAFFGIGAYAFGLAQFNVVANLWLCLAAATLAAALSGAVVAAFISHRRGIYYALMTIAFGQIFWFIAIKAHSITGGEDGLLKIERLPLSLGITRIELASNVSLYYFVFAIFVCVSLLLWRLVHSPFGRIVKAIKQNETRARFVGYDVWRYKAAVLVISAGLSGLAGALYCLLFAYVGASYASLQYSTLPLLYTLLGGTGVTLGPLAGTAIMYYLIDISSSFTSSYMIIVGAALLIITLWFPDGIAGQLRRLFSRRAA